MKKLLIFLLSTLSLIGYAKENIALLEPRVGDGSTPVTAMEKNMVRGELRKAIINFSGFDAITRTNDIDQIMNEQNFQRTGLVSDPQIKKLGEMLGADYICVSTLTKSNTEFYLEAYLIHVESGRMSNPATQYGELTNGKLANMYPACKALAEELLNGTSSISSLSSNAFELYEKGVEYNEAQEYTEAFRLFMKAAEQGVPEAQYALGIYYESGTAVQLNYSEAAKWYRKAAERGNAEAQLMFAQCLMEGKGTPKNVREAIQWYEKSAKQGNVDAQRLLGGIYANGEVVNQDFESAVYWFRKAAEQENAEAQRLLGICYEEGYGVSQNYKTAVYWYKNAAEGGDDVAQFNLGACYYNGHGVSADLYKAFDLFKEAANQGNVDAMHALGVCYEYGEGVALNITKAKYWYKKAADNGSAQAREALNRL